MTEEQVKKTMRNLYAAIYARHARGKTTNEVHMGAKLLNEIKAAYSYTTTIKSCENDNVTIFGIPVVIDHNNDMRLEIAEIEKVPVETVPDKDAEETNFAKWLYAEVERFKSEVIAELDAEKEEFVVIGRTTRGGKSIAAGYINGLIRAINVIENKEVGRK